MPGSSCTTPSGSVVQETAWQLVGPNGMYMLGNDVLICPGWSSPPENPPPAGQVWRRVLLPQPVINISPGVAGITQLPSWFWVSGAGQPVSTTTNLDGWTVTASVDPVGYHWDFGDGTSAQSISGGDETNPSATHTYLAKGSYYVTLVIEYGGSYTISGYGASISNPLGPYDQAAVIENYTVQEVRSVLVPRGQGGG
jgi:hypothetical protein